MCRVRVEPGMPHRLLQELCALVVPTGSGAKLLKAFKASGVKIVFAP